MTLQGHLSDYPFSLLLAMLEYRSETGRLQIRFESGPGIFHFKDGKLISASVGPVKGFHAIRAALLLPAAPFHFDFTEGACADPEARIDEVERRQIATRLTDFDSKGSSAGPMYSGTALQRAGNRFETFDNRRRLLLRAEDALAYIRSHARLATAAIMLLLTVSAVLAITVSLERQARVSTSEVTARPSNDVLERANSAPSVTPQFEAVSPSIGVENTIQYSETAPRSSALTMKSTSTSPTESRSNEEPVNPKVLPRTASPKTITVVLQIEEGRVSEAYVKDHHPGWEAFEATAIRLARHRRYGKDKSGPDTVLVKVSADP